MGISILKQAALTAMVIVLAGCGGGGSGGSGSGGTNTAPGVDAGANQTVTEGATVMLAATLIDQDGDAVITWSQRSGPTVTLSDTSTEDPTFVAPSVAQSETVVLQMQADDGVNPAIADTVSIRIENSSLTVSAGFGRIVLPGASVALNANASDLNAGLSWTQVSGTAVTLSNTDTEEPSFTAPNVSARESLVFEITADNGIESVVTDQVTVEVWVAADSSSDKTVLGDQSGNTGWSCDIDPITTPTSDFTTMGASEFVTGNGIPGHATGTFPNARNPNAISAQMVDYFLPVTPSMGTGATEIAIFGVTIDGVKLQRNTAEFFNNNMSWNYEAVTPGLAEMLTAGAEFTWLGTDCNNAHVQPNGAYHYHAMMEGLINREGEMDGTASDMILGGYAADGYPFYLRYAYTNAADASSPLKVMEASWEIRAGARSTMGSNTPGGNHDGTFREDWAYVPASGDLDECNGRTGPTPEFPGGTYYYVITDDYPYIPRCVSGVVSDNRFFDAEPQVP